MRTVTRTDPNKISLIRKLKTKSKEANKRIWALVASEMARPRRRRIAVNLTHLNRHSSSGDVIIVPGKVLGSGVMNHKISIAAEEFSESAKQKLLESGSIILKIDEMMEKYPEGSNIKIMK
ncbi:MAG: 50S ribosomal protein L18e [Candidatus Hodarchaeales archaeon]